MHFRFPQKTNKFRHSKHFKIQFSNKIWLSFTFKLHYKLFELVLSQSIYNISHPVLFMNLIWPFVLTERLIACISAPQKWIYLSTFNLMNDGMVMHLISLPSKCDMNSLVVLSYTLSPWDDVSDKVVVTLSRMQQINCFFYH